MNGMELKISTKAEKKHVEKKVKAEKETKENKIAHSGNNQPQYPRL